MKKHIEQVEGDSGDRKEVHGGHGFAVIVKKRKPRLAGAGFLGTRRIQREIVRSDTSKPSMRSSPWMRGAPQVGFPTAI
jgi:hypothetical protein